MKTALLKTDLWDDDTFFEMNIDTKLVYLTILTCKERGVGRVYKLGDRILSFRSGLTVKQLQVCQGQLADLGLVHFHDGYVYLTEKSSFIQPVKGKLTKTTLEKEIREIPRGVAEHFASLTGVALEDFHRSLSGDPQEYGNVNDNDDDNVHVKDNDIVFKKEKEIHPEAVRLAELLRACVSHNYPENRRYPNEIKNWSKDIEKLNRIDKRAWHDIEYVIKWSQQHTFWKRNIQSGGTLREKWDKLSNQIKDDNEARRNRVEIL